MQIHFTNIVSLRLPYRDMYNHDHTLALITVFSSFFILGPDEAFINTLVFLLNDDTSGVWSLEHVDGSVYNCCTIVGFIINKTLTITDPSYIRCKHKSDKTENHLCQHIRVWYLSYWRAANALASLCKCMEAYKGSDYNNEPWHDKSQQTEYAPSEDSDPPGHPSSLINLHSVPSGYIL